MRAHLLPGLAFASLPCPAAGRARALEGDWVVDLSTPASGPYTRTMQLRLQPDGTVEGRFHDSPIEAGRWTDLGDGARASFRPRDGAGPYHAADCTSGAAAPGQSRGERRGLLVHWTATRPLAVPAGGP